jgi:precorrin-4/cobalt-precorrin-4 C11-methyltransferase
LPAVAQTLVLTRISGRASAMPAGESLAGFAASGATLAIHLAIHALDQVVAELVPVCGPDCPAAIVVQASRSGQRVLRGRLGALAHWGAGIERTALILVGRALASEDFADSALYDPDYRRRFRGPPS